TDIGSNKHLLVADHYQHLALIAVLALVAAGWSRSQGKLQGTALQGTALYAAAGAILAGPPVLTWQQCCLYVDATTLYRATLERNPEAFIAHNNLGVILYQSGGRLEAVEHYQQALRVNPT